MYTNVQQQYACIYAYISNSSLEIYLFNQCRCESSFKPTREIAKEEWSSERHIEEWGLIVHAGKTQAGHLLWQKIQYFSFFKWSLSTLQQPWLLSAYSNDFSSSFFLFRAHRYQMLSFHHVTSLFFGNHCFFSHFLLLNDEIFEVSTKISLTFSCSSEMVIYLSSSVNYLIWNKNQTVQGYF